MLRQKARPYLFSNSVPPSVVAGTIAALDLITSDPELAAKVRENAREFRALMVEEGFDLLPGVHPIVPVMFSDEHVAAAMAKALFDRGIYAVAFSYPVVPMGKARIRVQLSASHTFDEIRECVKAFVDAREELSAEIHE
jgi:glycine C-acetyltransferase